MQVFYKRSPYFYFYFLLFFFIGAIILLAFSKDTIHLALNDWHTPFGDLIFPYITKLGEEILLIIAAIYLLFTSFRKTAFSVISIGTTGIITQILKLGVFSEFPRPRLYFDETILLNLVEGVEVHLKNTFPSGHTSQSFAFFCTVALLTKSKSWGWEAFYFLAAFMVGFSRMYLQLHFFEDIFAGAVLGVSVTTLWYELFRRYFPFVESADTIWIK